MRRVTEVLDCWFESGSMPFAQVHYPFENAEWFESHYPGDFIVEYMAQTRGWFYTLHVWPLRSFDRPAFRTCISHGSSSATTAEDVEEPQQLPDPMMAFHTYGADAMRWYLLSSTILRGGDLAGHENGIRESVRHIVLPIWNTYSFFTDVRQRLGPHRRAPHRVERRPRPVHPRQDARADRRGHRGDGRLRPLRGMRIVAHVPRRS
jgi:isoleucyl-tRNA synthetase